MDYVQSAIEESGARARSASVKVRFVVEDVTRLAELELGGDFDLADLQADFANGMTLHQIADTKGISLAQFTPAVLAAEKAQLTAAVKAGSITQAQADQISQRESAAKIAARWDSADHGAHSSGTTPATPSTPATTGKADSQSS